MRTSLFLSTLFAVSMVGGAALAEKPQGAAKEPQVLEHLRAHGDTVDKVYHAPAAERVDRSAAQSSQRVRTQAPAPSAKNPLDKAASRINCSDSDPHCASMHAPTQAATGGADAAATSGYQTRRPAFLDKILGSDRTNFNEAGEDQGMSSRAANRAWSHARHSEASATVPLAQHQQVDRKSQQYQSSRVSCNEADDCEISSKEVKKEWAYAAVKAGTWTGPEKPEPSNAARRIAADRAAESASLHDEKAAQAAANHTHGGGAAAAAPHEADHPH
jgi:hypothetical protein